MILPEGRGVAELRIAARRVPDATDRPTALAVYQLGRVSSLDGLCWAAPRAMTIQLAALT